MSSAFDSDNTTGSAWLGSSIRTPGKSGHPSAWKMRNQLSDDFLAGSVSHSSSVKAHAAHSNATTRPAKKHNSSKAKKPSRLVSKPDKTPFLQQFTESIKRDFAEASEVYPSASNSSGSKKPSTRATANRRDQKVSADIQKIKDAKSKNSDSSSDSEVQGEGFNIVSVIVLILFFLLFIAYL